MVNLNKLTAEAVASAEGLLSLAFHQTPSGGTMIELQCAWGSASISLQGGQVLRWHPRHQQVPVLWMSESAIFKAGKALRGGVPICWPWFGPHPRDATLVAHGYARQTPWRLERIKSLSGGQTQLDLMMIDDGQRPSGWVDGLGLSTSIVLGETLQISLETLNSSALPVTLTEGLHTYLRIGDIEAVSVEGLDRVEYIDLLDRNARKIGAGAIAIDAEFGRIYANTTASCIVVDRRLGRRLMVQKSGSLSTAIWNPWLATASTMDDLGPTAWRELICVETANALENEVTIAPGASHRMTAIFSAVSEETHARIQS